MEANNKNEVIHSNDIVLKFIDTIATLGKMNHQMTYERKERLKNVLLKDYKAICEQDHSESKQLFGIIWLIMLKKQRLYIL